jgi:hypothetical protein
MRRREFITLLGGAGGAWLLVVDAEQAVFPQSLSAPADATMNSEACCIAPTRQPIRRPAMRRVGSSTFRPGMACTISCNR